MEVPSVFDWVTERSKCCLEQVFNTVAEVIEADVKTASGLGQSGVIFKCNRAHPKRVIVSRTKDFIGIKETRSVVFELTETAVTATATDHEGNGAEIFSATPHFHQEGQCLLEIKGEPHRLWQVSRKALEDLFFGL